MMTETDLQKTKDFLSRPGLDISISIGRSCAQVTSIKAGGRCAALIEVNDAENLARLVKYLIDNKALFYIIGDGTNVLFKDGFNDIFLIKLSGCFNLISIAGNGWISAGASSNLQRLIVFSAKLGFDLSYLAGIPGTVGGAVACNSGTVKKGICDYVKKVSYLSLEDGAVIAKESELEPGDYGYRYFYKQGLIVLTGILLKPDINRKEDIFNNIRQNIKNKKISQPLNSLNAGCFFKNPAGTTKSAGEIIDLCGLKRFSFGGAMVSEKHANFIVNTGDASSKDILVLSRIVKELVKNNFNIDLEYEIKLVGF